MKFSLNCVFLRQNRRISFAFILPIVVFLLFLASLSSAEVNVYFEGDVPRSVLPKWIVVTNLNDADYKLTVYSKREMEKEIIAHRRWAMCFIIPLPPPWHNEFAPTDEWCEVCIYNIRLEKLTTGDVSNKKLRILSKTYYSKVEPDMPKDFLPLPENELRKLFGDKNVPQITLRLGKDRIFTTNDFLVISYLALDDLGVNRISVNRQDSIFTKTYKGITQVSDSIFIPLKLGENQLDILCEDIVGNVSGRQVMVFRKKMEESTISSENRIMIPIQRPTFDFSISLYENKNIWWGGEKIGFIVTVENKGKGKGDVDIVLSGDEYLLKLFSKIRSIGEIEPGKTKSEVFTVDLPTEPPEKEATLYIELKEKIWGESPTKKEQIKVALVKAEKTIVEETPELLYPIPNIFEGKRQKGYALIIGLSKYSNVLAPKYSKNDAEVFSEYVAKVFGISNSKSVYDDKATIGTIKANLTDWLKKKQGFKIIYFAGHGVPDPENPREGDVYLLPYDGDPELKSTLISLKEIAELGANRDDTVLMFLDACFSGGEGRTVQLAQRPLVVAKISETNAITFAAAEGSQPSKEFEKAQHGYFTYYTLLGLKGRADVNGDGWITTTELYDFVKNKVSDATNNVQIPVLRPEKDIRIGRVK